MNFNINMPWFRSKEKEPILKKHPMGVDLQSNTAFAPQAHTNPIFAWSYDGEKNPGEIGIIKDYIPEYRSLRIRAWQSLLESEISQTIIKKYILWIIGAGLKLQTEPDKEVLKSEGIELPSDFVKSVESRFRLFAKSKRSSHSGMVSIHRLASRCYKEGIVGGDNLVILRVVNGELTVELVDGKHLVSPRLNHFHVRSSSARGNRIRNGIELNSKAQHIAYYISTEKGIKRIKARNSEGEIMAFLVYGTEFRLDNVRGIPSIATSLETLKKLDRYKEATVGSAEERAKIPYFIKHGTNSSGENPHARGMIQAQASMNNPGGKAIETAGTDYDNATQIALTTQKQVFNMEQDSELVSLESKNDLNFKDFYISNVQSVTGSLGIPYEVALSMYNSNYSASRAAIKDWEHTIKVNREFFTDQFYKPIYNVWLTLQILQGKIKAKGYIDAYFKKDFIIIEAYHNCWFSGANVPNIDPLKEVRAEKEKLGPLAEHLPLTTLEKATDVLGTGDWDSINTQFEEELEKSKLKTIEENTLNNLGDGKK